MANIKNYNFQLENIIVTISIVLNNLISQFFDPPKNLIL